jgi:UDP-glucose 4-epimerase
VDVKPKSIGSATVPAVSESALTVAVTGPTGEIGVPFMRALERTAEVGRVLAMARRPFDPAEHGWSKAEYRQGDILDRAAVDALVAEADVVVHLAFIVVKASAGSYDINIDGSRNVFEATVAAGVPRLIYTSSVAAYGYHGDVDGPLTEDMPPRGTEAHAYSHQKAAVEQVLDQALSADPPTQAGADRPTQAYVFRPCIVAGPDAPALLNQLPYLQLENRVPAALLAALGRVPGLQPVLPDHGIAFQLVHHDDVADALTAAVLGRGAPGIYNLAAPGEITLSDLAHELGWHSVPVPKATIGIAARILAQIPPLAVEAGWLEALRTSVLMSTDRVREELGWDPVYDARQTLRDLVAARR